MIKEKNNIIIDDKVINIYLFLSSLVLLLLFVIGYNDIAILVERAKSIFGFWILLFLIIFLPRRMLKRSKNFRYLILYLKKKYPIILFYRVNLFNIIEYLYFFYQYIIFYLERVLKYILVGTKVKWLKPYKKDWEKGEFLIQIIVEIIRGFFYLIIYIFKIFYEVIRFFDYATLYKIIRSRLLGFLFISIGYTIIGINFFIIYLLSFIFIFIIYSVVNIFFSYKDRKKNNIKNLTPNQILAEVLIWYGIVNKILILYLDIVTLRQYNLLFVQVLRIKKDSFILLALKKKYSIANITKYALNLNFLIEVVFYKNDYLLVQFLPKNFIINNKLEVEKISKYIFTTNFLKKKEWYQKNDLAFFKVGDSFNNSIYGYNHYFVNKLDYQIYFLRKIYPILNDDNDIILNDKNLIEYKNLFDYKIIEQFFEFVEIVNFIKLMEKKISEEGGPIFFNKKYFLDNNVGNTLENLYLVAQQNKNITEKELELSYVLVLYDLLKNLNCITDEKEIEELLELKYNEFLKKD